MSNEVLVPAVKRSDPAGRSIDMTPVVAAALVDCKRKGAGQLRFEPGEYHFWPDRAAERYVFASNNDDSLKRIVFAMDEFEDFRIDGGDSKFVFHGQVVPFVIAGCRNLRLGNFTMDWTRTFHSEGRVLTVPDDGVDVEIEPRYPFSILHERLVFAGEHGEAHRIGNILEFDSVRRETAFNARDQYGAGDQIRALELEKNADGSRRVRLKMAFTTRPIVGNVLVFQDGGRHCPAIVIQDSADVRLSDITLHHAGGMGVIAQYTRDIALERIRVVPSAGRTISLPADATHFVNCGGAVSMTDCSFANQMDDATNVHGIYGQITRRVSDRVLEVRNVHPQQQGIDIARAGDKVELVRSDTLATFHEGKVASAERVNKEYSFLTLEQPLPADVREGDCVGNLSWQADVTIRGCDARGNRARGFLISTAGKVLIEKNIFHTPGSAILIAGDANYWFESGRVRDVTIRGNTFDGCNFGVWGRALIDIHPEIPTPRLHGPAYHHGITIEDNLIRAFDGRIVRADSVDGITFRNNRIVTSNDHPAQHSKSVPVHLNDCSNAVVDYPVSEPVPEPVVPMVKAIA